MCNAQKQRLFSPPTPVRSQPLMDAGLGGREREGNSEGGNADADIPEREQGELDLASRKPEPKAQSSGPTPGRATTEAVQGPLPALCLLVVEPRVEVVPG